MFLQKRRPLLTAGCILVSVVFFLILSTPRFSAAVGSPACVCQMNPKIKNPPFCPLVVCTDVTSGFSTVGHCASPGICKGETSSGQGGDMKGLQEALGIAKQIMDLLKGAGGGEGGGDAGANALGGCLSGYYNTTSPSSTDPCAMYTPSVYTDSLGTGSNSSNVSNSLLDALGGGNNTTNVSETLNSTTQASTSAQTQQQTQTSVQTPTTSRSLTGSVRVGETGATIISNLREGVSEVAGFFGGSTFGGNSSQSVAGRLCVSRPWAKSGALAKLIPDTFLDSICSRAGYQVGVTTPAPSGAAAQPNRVTRPSTSVPTTTPQRPADLGPVEVNIWAEPASVRLGTRTYLFWSSKNVVDCTVTGPNFTQRSLSGGASTVPISGPTTYTLSCTSPSGATSTDSVTVNLAL